MSTTTELDLDFAREVLADYPVVVPATSPAFVRLQGDASTNVETSKLHTAQGRIFKVTGPGADRVRKAIFADGGFTRKQIAELAGVSVSRVAEVVWGLEADGIEYPAIPRR